MPKTYNLLDAVLEFNRICTGCLIYDKTDNALYVVRNVKPDELLLEDDHCIIASKVKARSHKARATKNLSPTEVRKRIEVFNRTLKLFA